LAISNGISILDQKLLLFIKKVSHFALKIEPELANLEHFFHDHTASLFLSGGCRSASSVLGKSVGDGAGSKGGGKLDLVLGKSDGDGVVLDAPVGTLLKDREAPEHREGGTLDGWRDRAPHCPHRARLPPPPTTACDFAVA
jgi:hypothetical protein